MFCLPYVKMGRWDTRFIGKLRIQTGICILIHSSILVSKTPCAKHLLTEVSNNELEHLRNVLKLNGYPRQFIDKAMKMPQRVQRKTEYQSSVCLPYIGPASHQIERILKEVGVQVYHSSQNKLFRSLCTHKDRVDESQKPGVYRIPCECGLVYIGETGRNLSKRLKEHKTNCEKAELDKSAVAKHAWTYDHRTLFINFAVTYITIFGRDTTTA